MVNFIKQYLTPAQLRNTAVSGIIKAAKADAKKPQEVTFMQIGEVIRKYRKSKNMTQEEMANRLGVTAPAVNKWENGASLPDIMLLAPIARLLGITVDNLLSFREDLTESEIREIVNELDAKLQCEAYEDVFSWAREKLSLYPNCQKLIYQLALILDAWRLTHEIENSERYTEYINECYIRALSSEDESIKRQAADSLLGFYLRNEQYDKAEECLSYFSQWDPERKRNQADIYSKTGRKTEAYKEYEEMLFSGYQMTCMVLQHLYIMAVEEGEMERAHVLVNKQSRLANIFEMGEYHEIMCGLELATIEKDADTVIETAEKMISCVDKITDFRNSPLYEHMTFKEMDKEFFTKLKKDLLDSFRDEETYGFMKEDKRWQKLLN